MAFFLLELFFCGHFLDLIFEDAKTWFEKRSFNVIGMLYWKREASSKNNALNYRVRCGSSVSKGIIFYLLTEMFLIALVEKLMFEI